MVIVYELYVLPMKVTCINMMKNKVLRNLIQIFLFLINIENLNVIIIYLETELMLNGSI